MEDKELSFWDHLDELRWALARIIAIWFVLAIGFFIAMPYIFDTIILGPCHNDFVFYKVLYYIGNTLHLEDDFFTSEFDITLQSINIAAPFFVHLTTSFILSIVVTVPYLLWEIWKFIRPALYENEYRGIKKALALGSIMFFLGCAVGYFMVFPLALRFLATYNLSSSIIIEINLNSYIDTFMMLTLCMGLCFELPLVTWLLSLMGILNRQTLRTYRRHAIVVIVIVAAIITPTGDPFTLTAVSLPLYLLYELSIFMIKDKPEEEDDDDDDDPGTGIVRSNPTTPTPAAPKAAATAAAAAAPKALEAEEPKALEGSEPKQLESSEPKQLESNPDPLPESIDDLNHDPSMEEIEDILRRQREAAEEAKKASMATAVTMTSAELHAQSAESPTAHFEAYSDEAEMEEWEKENASPSSMEEEETASQEETETQEPSQEEGPEPEEVAESSEDSEPQTEDADPDPDDSPEDKNEPDSTPEPSAEAEEKPAPSITSNGINISGITYDYRRFQS